MTIRDKYLKLGKITEKHKREMDNLQMFGITDCKSCSADNVSILLYHFA